MRILGIDPGYAIVGFGLIEAERAQARMESYGAITTPAGLPLSKRLLQIDRDAQELLETLKPDVVAVERLFFNTNRTTGIAVAHSRGVILCAVERCGVPLCEYTPSQVKIAVTGYGKADKRQVMDMTRRILRLKSLPKPDDAADALSIALCHARSATSRLPRPAPNGKTV
ncbi:MAG: crossover junction endodeoxyribonuclease RuvC [Oscillibacter sp.]|nr:crossover junction endodeoxyribonuclease RuvC [Oscillibacter sp.]